MAEVPAQALPICRSEELVDRGRACLFDVVQYGATVRAFVMRHDGRLVAYLNRCVHVPAEMDWLPGEFLDQERQFIICSIHGATYRPGDGQCVGGPCGRGRLTALRVAEEGGSVYWYPSGDIRPAPSVKQGQP